jgi:hypothetical protein
VAAAAAAAAAAEEEEEDFFFCNLKMVVHRGFERLNPAGAESFISVLTRYGSRTSLSTPSISVQ